MESSSDESFAWRTDSKQNSDSEDITAQMENSVENGFELQSTENTYHSERKAKKRKNEGHVESPKRKKIKTDQQNHIEKYKSVDVKRDDDDNYWTMKVKQKKHGPKDNNVLQEELNPKEGKLKKSKMNKEFRKINNSTSDVTYDEDYLSVKAKEEELESEEHTPKKLKKRNDNKKKCKLNGDVTDDKQQPENEEKCNMFGDNDNCLSMKAKQEELSTEEIIPKNKKKKKSKELKIKTDCVEENNVYMADSKNKKKSKSIDIMDNDENFLTLKAKEEILSSDEVISKKSKKNKCKELVTERDCVAETSGVNLSDHKNIKERKSIDDLTDNDGNYLTIKAKEERLSSDEVISKKSKKMKENLKKHQSNEVTDDDDNYLSMKAKQEEIDMEESTPKSKKKRITKEWIIGNDCVEETNEPHEPMNTHNDTFMGDQDSLVETPQTQVVDSVSKANESFDEPTFNTSFAAKKIVQTPRMCDRIRFEDDESDVETPLKINKNDTENLARLRHFLKARPSLNSIKEKSPNIPTVTEDDEIWMLKCPFEMDVSALFGKEINLVSQCKIKTNDDSYYSTVQNECIRIPIMTYAQNKHVIQSRLCKNVVSFRKRIPKLHIQDDRSIYQDPSHFIPLPETKSRHPLFGSNYKKAIKIPKQVAERLNFNSNTSIILGTERKKKKKRDKQVESLKVEPMESESIELVKDVGRKKRKKERKQTEEAEPPRKMKKKHNLESAEVWGSEAKIEESLFDF